MNCTSCGHPLTAEDMFCDECGAEIKKAAPPVAAAPAPAETTPKVCASCGKTLKPNLRFCNGCGTPVAASAQAAPQPSPIAEELKARSRDAWAGLKVFAKNPVGGLAESYALFDDRRAMRVGISFIVAYEIFIFLTWLLSPSANIGIVRIGLFRLGFNKTVPELFQLIMTTLAPVAGVIAVMAILRAIFRCKGKISGDVYTAGATLLPWGMMLFIGMLLGFRNVEIILALALFANAYSILILYAGCSRIAGIPETSAAPAVPAILLISGWLTKVIGAAVF